jgi:hypothetical protein
MDPSTVPRPNIPRAAPTEAAGEHACRCSVYVQLV